MQGPSANLLTLACALLTVSTCNALDNGLGIKPAMGFNTWNAFNVDSASPARALRDQGSRNSVLMDALQKVASRGLSVAACTSVRRTHVHWPHAQLMRRRFVTWRTPWWTEASWKRATRTSTSTVTRTACHAGGMIPAQRDCSPARAQTTDSGVAQQLPWSRLVCNRGAHTTTSVAAPLGPAMPDT